MGVSLLLDFSRKARQVILYGFTIFLIISCGTLNPQQKGTNPVDHTPFSRMLGKYVDGQGMVDYAAWSKDRDSLSSYLELLSHNLPNDSWTDHEQLAYWINVYNAFTIDLILEHYPLSSIRDLVSGVQVPFVRSPWDIKFIKLGDEVYDLNNIEHSILRKKWQEPRIHFAINCASMSCPVLRNEAYSAQKLESQLEEQAKRFLNDGIRNVITNKDARLSKIFDWYGADFTQENDLKTFINQYATRKIDDKTEIEFLNYDWSLNEQ